MRFLLCVRDDSNSLVRSGVCPVRLSDGFDCVRGLLSRIVLITNSLKYYPCGCSGAFRFHTGRVSMLGRYFVIRLEYVKVLSFAQLIV